MVKHSPLLMSAFFTRERFGRPQLLAGLLLLMFLAQCVWLLPKRGYSHRNDPGPIERIARGREIWKDRSAGPLGAAEGLDPHHSPLWYLVASAPLLMVSALWTSPRPMSAGELRALAAAPYLIFGLLLGASLWYVARRLFGNTGGYVALALYCFSPGVIRSSLGWWAEPQVGAAWGAFGAVFTAIAVAHTLYAPREVILWNWRRILLLGLSVALAVGSQFSLVVVLPIALGFMLYLAPTRRLAAAAIWLVGCAIGKLLLFATYFFRPAAIWEGMKHASFLPLSPTALTMPQAWREVGAQLGQSSPALVLALPAAVITYIVWPRARYFGNTASLLVAAVFLSMAVGTPHDSGLGFQFVAIPFLFVFVAGIAADLVETRRRQLALAGVWGLLVANAVWNLWELARAGLG